MQELSCSVPLCRQERSYQELLSEKVIFKLLNNQTVKSRERSLSILFKIYKAEFSSVPLRAHLESDFLRRAAFRTQFHFPTFEKAVVIVYRALSEFTKLNKAVPSRSGTRISLKMNSL